MLVVTALSMVALLAFAGLVIDGGRMYSQHREVQNSSDAAALAGASALNTIINTPGADASVIRTAVQASITANGTTGFTCTLVDVNANPVSACPTTTATLPSGTAGVSVQATDNPSTSFTKVIGIDSFTAAANATAQVQALKAGRSPFMLCGWTVAADKYPQANPPLNADGTINPANIGKEYILHDPKVSDCGLDSSKFKGLADDKPFSIPGVWDGDNGTKAGPVRQTLAGPNACATGTEGKNLPIGCTLTVPLCHPVPGYTGNDPKLYCTVMATFEITQADSNTQKGRLIGTTSVVTSGGQGGGIPQAGEARLIKLTQ
jgi:Flp pilus assembly protein TadG